MKKRYYGSRQDVPEDPKSCIAEVRDRSDWHPYWYQCTRNRKTGPGGNYCKQHADMIADGRRVRVPKLMK